MIAGPMTTGERSEIRWGTTGIPYAIRRSSRRGTVSVAVEPSGQVVLTAPLDTPIARLDRVVRQKARWIVERSRRSRDLARPSNREFVSGETVRYLGRSYRLRVVMTDQVWPPRLERGWLVVSTSCSQEGGGRRKDVRNQLMAWYRTHAQAQLTERVARWAGKLGLQTREVLMRDPPRRWGSCDASGTLRFNWRIIQAAAPLVDYVVVHELVHLVHRGHDARFWSTVAKVMPAYEARRASLREIGPTMQW